MKTDEEIIKNLKQLGEFAREGLINQRKSDFSRHFNVLTAIRNTVKERHVEDLEQMLRDKLKEIPDPKNPKEKLDRHLKILDIKHELAKAKEGIKKSADSQKVTESKPRGEISGKTVKERGPAKVHLKSSAMKRTRPSKPITKTGQNKKT